jgi:hypothetical protein
VAEGNCFAAGEAVTKGRVGRRRPVGTSPQVVGDGRGRTAEKRPRPSEG